jgi:hypothetical protein
MGRKLAIMMVLIVGLCPLLAEDWLTIYNDDLSLVRSKFELKLTEGRQEVNFDDITSRISPASVIVTPEKGDLKVAEQNYEYDLAGKWQIMLKYLDKEVTVVTKDQSRYRGIMKFYDGTSYGIQESDGGKLVIVNEAETQAIQLAELPANFYVKPTLHWSLIAGKGGTYPIQMTYLTGGLSWDVTYNCVWDKKLLDMNSWVTIGNQSGKAFKDVSLKLIAGDVNVVQDYYYDKYSRYEMADSMAGMVAPAPPSFEEKAFHDFHMYTLDQKVSFADNQTKQIALYPTQHVKATPVYEYLVWGSGVNSMIKFKNTEENGIGKPLPKGIMKVYMKDTDGNLEFIGEDRIDHTGRNEEVVINTGTAFDLVGSTLVKDQETLKRNESERSFQITLRNNSQEKKSINVIHQLGGNSRIISSDIKPEIDTNLKATFTVEIEPDKEVIFTFREKTTY